MPINDPFARTGQMFRDLGGAYRARLERDRQAPLDAANLRAKDQTYEVNQVNLEETRRKLGQQAEMRGALDALPTTRDVPTLDPSDNMAQIGAGPQLPTQAPLSQYEVASGRSKVRQQFGDVEGAIKEFEVPGKATDVSQKIRGTKIEGNVMGLVEASQRGGVQAMAAYLQANGQDPSKAKNFTVIPGGFIQTEPDGSKTMTTAGPKGVVVKHIAAPSKAGAGSQRAPRYKDLYNLDGDGKTYSYIMNDDGTPGKKIGEVRPTGEGSQVDDLSEDAIDDAAIRTLADPKYKFTGGRVAKASNDRRENKASELRRDLGMDVGDILTKPMEFSAQTKNYTKLQARKSMAGIFVRNMDKQMLQFEELIERVRYDNPAILNAPWQAFQTYVQGSGDLGAYHMLVTDLSNEAGKLSSGAEASVAALTEGQAEKWSGIHYLGMPTNELVSLLNETVRVGHQRVESYTDEMNDIKQNVRGMVGANNPKNRKLRDASNREQWPGAPDINTEKGYFRYTGGNPNSKDSWVSVN